jgi:predicted phosphodiesterase
MGYALIADIHANLPALEAALEALAGIDREIDGYLCAGDLVGYGPHPNECVERLRSLGALSVAGNHDLMAVGRLPVERADELARTTLEWTRTALSEETRAYLLELPLRARSGSVAIAHGSLEDARDYVRDAAAAGAQLEALAVAEPDASLLLLGHTHTPAAYGSSSGRLRGSSVRRPAAERWLVNPGSVGQAREWRPLVRFAVLDPEREECSFHAVSYDTERTRRDLLAAGLPTRAAHRRPRLRSKLKRALKGLTQSG